MRPRSALLNFLIRDTMKLTNVSNYPVLIKGTRIETEETKDVEIDNIERYREDRRFLLEEDNEPQEIDDEPDEEKSETESDEGGEIE